MKMKYLNVCVWGRKCEFKEKHGKRLPRCFFNSTCNQKIEVVANNQADLKTLRKARRSGQTMFT